MKIEFIEKVQPELIKEAIEVASFILAQLSIWPFTKHYRTNEGVRYSKKLRLSRIQTWYIYYNCFTTVMINTDAKRYREIPPDVYC